MDLLRPLRRRAARSGRHAATVRAAFAAVIGRPPADTELADAAGRLDAGVLSVAELLAELARDRPAPGTPETVVTAPDPLTDLPAPARARATALADMTHLGPDDFDRAWRATIGAAEELVVGQRDYLRVHYRRFRELFNAVLALTGDNPRILEIGTSEASRLYRQLLPDAEVVTADRPVGDDYIGFTPARSRAIADARTHVSIDLERDDPGAHAELSAAGPFDLIVFTEVLEHLVTPPDTLIAGLLARIRPAGALYITTPNFLSRANRARIADGLNPQPFYPGSEANWDRHHHFREYTMRELLDLVAAAGGHVDTAYYSACWDEPDREGHAHPAQRANLVVVARRDAN